jgi:DNA modification methylase
MHHKIYQGDVIECLKKIPDESVNCIITSPPYWGLRDYGTGTWEGGDLSCSHRKEYPNSSTKRSDGAHANTNHALEPYKEFCGRCGAKRIDMQIGLEKTPEVYVKKLVGIFRELRRVLRKDGTVWLNLGDSYCGSWGNYGGQNRGAGRQRQIINGSHAEDPAYKGHENWRPPTANKLGIKEKDLVGMPWRMAFALQADGWYLRRDIIWSKPNPMPESVKDRPTTSHEYVFLLTKSAKYYYDAAAIAGSGRLGSSNKRNKRSVWNITPKPFKGARGTHFAIFPPELPETCMKAGCPQSGVVMDPFAGSGTVMYVAEKQMRDSIGIELNPEYIKIIQKRLSKFVGQYNLKGEKTTLELL